MLITNRWKAACARALIVALALLACLCFGVSRAEEEGMLRVKLTRLGSPNVLRMRADCDYYLASDPSVRVPAGAEMTLAASNGSLTLAVGQRVASLGPSAQLMRSEPGNRGVCFADPALSNRFCGDLYLSASEDVITTVLHIYVEDYLYGAVGCEMAPSSGQEALKAQAIVARNYALRRKADRTGAAYDLTDAGDALSFRGYNASSEYADAMRAVDATRGLTLYYGDSPAVCYYCDSNGGQTESAANALGAALPYSVVIDDPYDLDGAGPKRTAELLKDATGLRPELVDALIAGMADQLAGLGLSADPADVEITAIDDVLLGSARFAAPSRLYKSLIFRLSVSSLTPQGQPRAAQVSVTVPTYGALENWYELGINADDNETVWLNETDRAFEITFRRSGSGLGMSQRGAQVMARQGFACEDILDFYYPGTTVRSTDLADTTRDSFAALATPAPIATAPIATARLGQKARLYREKSEAGGAITTLPAGATVQVYAVEGEWAAIGSGDLKGFAHADAMTSFQLVGVTAAQVQNETVAQVSAGPVDVLQWPVAAAKVLDRLGSGTLVRLNAYTDAWALITTRNGVEGFIPRDALTLQADGGGDGDTVTAPEDLYGLLTRDAGLYVNADDSILPRATLPEGGYVRILAYNSAWAYVRTMDGDTGYVKLSCLSAVQQAQPEPTPAVEGGAVTVVKGKQYRYVAADALSLFESYSTDSQVLATLERGQRVRLGAYNGVWACVRVDGITGFVPVSGLSEADPSATEVPVEGGAITRVHETRYATVAAEEAPLYPSWSEADAPLARLEKGARVLLGAYNDAWACVRSDGVTGFIRVEALSLDAPEPTPGASYEECDAVTTEKAPLYDSAALTGLPVSELEEGAQVRVYAYDRRVAYVEFDGSRGYVSINALKKLP